ncbi:MAG: mannosyltransferase, partial [Actinomycetota bacterium]|nr:mannosyltransferase [Actinomycetota bacterium]
MSVHAPMSGEGTGPDEIGHQGGRHRLAPGPGVPGVPGGGERPAFAPGAVPELLVGATAAAVYGWGVWAPSPWRDEAATMAICRRSLDQILAVTENVDLVHLAFYLLAHVAVTVHDSVTSVRLISVVSMALAAAVVVRVGRRAGDTGTGALAGCLVAVSPLASRWAQDARPFALVTLVAVLSTLALLRAVERPSFPRWIVYGLGLVLLCLLNVLGLLLVSGHGTYLLLARRRALLPWAGAVVAVAGVSAPFLSPAFAQRGQVSWIAPPTPSDLASLFILTFGTPAGLAAVGAAGLVLLGGLVVGRLRLPDGPRWSLLALGCAWGVVPASVLWGVSLVKPLWDLHYVIFSLPGVALAAAAAVRLATGVVSGRPIPDGVSGDVVHRLRVSTAVVLAAVPVAATAAVSLPTHLAHRDPESGH